MTYQFSRNAKVSHIKDNSAINTNVDIVNGFITLLVHQLGVRFHQTLELIHKSHNAQCAHIHRRRTTSIYNSAFKCFFQSSLLIRTAQGKESGKCKIQTFGHRTHVGVLVSQDYLSAVHVISGQTDLFLRLLKKKTHRVAWKIIFPLLKNIYHSLSFITKHEWREGILLQIFKRFQLISFVSIKSQELDLSQIS